MDKLANGFWSIVDSLMFDEKEKRFVDNLRKMENISENVRVTNEGRIYRVKKEDSRMRKTAA